MKSYSSQDVAKAREWCEIKGFPKVFDESELIEYYVMPQSINPDFPKFVWACANPREGVFGIADSVNERFRIFPVLHEFLESKFSESGRDENTCLGVLLSELCAAGRVLSPVEFREGYVPFRKDFFDNLVSYAQSHPNDYSSGDIEGFRRSRDYLVRFLGGAS